MYFRAQCARQISWPWLVSCTMSYPRAYSAPSALIQCQWPDLQSTMQCSMLHCWLTLPQGQRLVACKVCAKICWNLNPVCIQNVEAEKVLHTTILFLDLPATGASCRDWATRKPAGHVDNTEELVHSVSGQPHRHSRGRICSGILAFLLFFISIWFNIVVYWISTS